MKKSTKHRSKKFRKKEIEEYNWLIAYIRTAMEGGRDFWSSLFSGGLTFQDDIKRFCHYASQMGASDISEEILKKHSDWV